MNDTLKCIAERYSCRDFVDTPLTDAQVKAIVEAALASPSAMNRQPWHVIMITDKSLIDEMDSAALDVLAAEEDKSAYERTMSRGGKLFYNAPCMVMVASDGSDFGPMDSGILSENVSLAAHSLGLGNVICGMARFPFMGPRGDELLKRIKFPEGYEFGMAILIGTAKSGKAPHELDYNKVTYI